MIAYLDSVQNLTIDSLAAGFFDGWPDAPSRETHVKILKQSDFVILAMDESTEKVIGFITAITDGVLSAYIPLLEVLPQYRHQGIGNELTRRMLDQLSDFYMIDLSCDPSLQTFYEQHNMCSAMAMVKRNYDRQSGL